MLDISVRRAQQVHIYIYIYIYTQVGDKLITILVSLYVYLSYAIAVQLFNDCIKEIIY